MTKKYFRQYREPRRARSRRGARSIISLALAAGLLALNSAGALSPGLPPFAHLATARAATILQEGANVTSANSTDFSSAAFQQSLKNLAATDANYVTLNIPLYQTSVNTTDVQAGGNAPTQQALSSAIQYAHSLGLHVMLKFDLYSGDGQWSANINPSDRTTWFANYQSAIMPFVSTARAGGAEEICLGTELIDMSTDGANSTNAQNWKSLITAVRNSYPGKLTYDANWGGSGIDDEKDNISFWGSLDYIGLSAYFNLSGDGSVASLMQSWASWNASDVTPLEQKWNKPILFTEIGYKAIYDSYTHPWMWWESGSVDEQQQANDYQAAIQYWSQFPWFGGMQFWYWSSNPSAGGSGDSDYTPQNKTAQATMQQWFSKNGGTGGGSAPAFAATASVSPSSPTANAAANFNVSLKDSGGAVSGANVDMEIYNSSGGQVFQKVFSGQNFAASSTQLYAFNWTPSSAGSYVLKIGVFSGDWTQNYFWNNNAAPFTVAASGGGGGGPTSTGATVNIWWPTNGATVTGVQPFKAMVPNMSVDTYSMYWQVDGGQLNTMASNDTDYPHKEASVNVSSWTWRGTGPYTVNFVAKDQSGSMIGQASVQIFN